MSKTSAQTLVGSNGEQGNTDSVCLLLQHTSGAESTRVKVQILVYKQYSFLSSVKINKYKGLEMYSKHESFQLTRILSHYNNDDDDHSFITEH